MIEATFRLDDSFIEKYKSIPAPFGFNGVGEFTYRRCVTIDTPVLCADFTWRAAGNLRPGQAIIAFDEEIRPGTKERNLCIAYVTDNSITDEKCVEVELEDGQKLYSTADHPWLANRYTNNQKLWVQAKDLENGPRGTAIALPQFFDVIEPDKSYMAGYLAAAFDGEGSFDGTSGLCFVQVENTMLKAVCDYLSEKGFTFKVKAKKNYGTKGSYESNQQCYEIRLTGGREQIFRFLMLIQPKRLMDVFLSKIETVTLRCSTARNKRVVAVRDAGERPIAVLSTTARTHFTAGFPSHNTYSRIKPDGTNEEWFETIRRVVEGCYRMQERHIKSQDLGWSNSRAQASAQEMYDRMFQMKFLPPGRGLWAMGSVLTEGPKPIYAALNNCGFTSTKNIDKDPISPFAFLMDMSMLGVGVGFDVRGAGKLIIKKPGCLDGPGNLSHECSNSLKRIYPDQKWDEVTTDYLGRPVTFRYKPEYVPNEGRYVFTIPDTREGWVMSVMYILHGFFKGTAIPTMDYSQIRPKGLLIKGFGGLSSGPEPLRELHEQLVRLLGRDIGKPISDENIVDIFNLEGCCVVAGNVRRSAEIAIGTSKQFLKLKDYKWDPSAGDDWNNDGKPDGAYVGPRADRSGWGWVSNNTIAAILGQDYTEVGDQTGLNGEPGYLWLENMRAYGRMGDPINWIDKDADGGNPCVPADTWVMTDQGPRRVTHLFQQFIARVDGKDYASSKRGFFYTGLKPLLEIKTKEGFNLRVTDNHKIKVISKLTEKSRKTTWVEAGKLTPGMLISLDNHRGGSWAGNGTWNQGWLLGSLLGDGHMLDVRAKLEYWGSERQHMLQFARNLLLKSEPGTRKDCGSAKNGKVGQARDWYSLGSTQLLALAARFGLDKNKEIGDSIEMASSDFYRGFLSGWLDADGSVQGTQNKGVSVRLGSVQYNNLEAAQRMFARLGIISTIYKRSEAGYRPLPNGKGTNQAYWCQESFDLVIANDNLQEFQTVVGFAQPDKQTKLAELLSRYKRRPNRERFTATIESITALDGLFPVYDATIDTVHEFDANGIGVHNCLEQTLFDKELCNLAELFPFRATSKEDFLRTIKFAYLYAKTVTLGRTHWRETNRVLLKNRRIGLSMSGIQQFIAANNLMVFKEWCEEGYAQVNYWDDKYSKWFCVPLSNKKTSIKPSGTISLVAGATPGMHWMENVCFLRRICVAKGSALLQPLIDAGYPVEDSVTDPSTAIVTFPVKVADNLRPVHKVSMWEQLSMAAFLQKYWADNQVSATITFDPETEAHQIKHALNYFQFQLKGVSFLPKVEAGAYAQMPYEEISLEEYEHYMAHIKPLNMTGAVEEVVEPERFCDGSKCQLTL